MRAIVNQGRAPLPLRFGACKVVSQSKLHEPSQVLAAHIQMKRKM